MAILLYVGSVSVAAPVYSASPQDLSLLCGSSRRPCPLVLHRCLRLRLVLQSRSPFLSWLKIGTRRKGLLLLGGRKNILIFRCSMSSQTRKKLDEDQILALIAAGADPVVIDRICLNSLLSSPVSPM